MTADAFRAAVFRLANSGVWCRCWLHWNFPARTPVLMAVSVRDRDGDAEPYAGDMLRHGFRREAVDNVGWVWVVERTNPDGTPYTSPMA